MSSADPMAGIGLNMLRNIDVSLSVELGRAHLPLRKVLELGADSIVPLERLTDELLEVFVNGKLIARGEVVAQDGKFALRVVEMVTGADEASA